MNSLAAFIVFQQEAKRDKSENICTFRFFVEIR